jgi:hypothetical protein
MSSPEPSANPPRKSARSRIAVNFEPLTARLQLQSWLERLRRDVKIGGYGLAISLLIHAVLMIALAFKVFVIRSTDDGDPLIASWLTPGEKAEAAVRRRQPLSLPIEVGSLPATKPVEKVPSEAGDLDNTPKPGVSPVSVGQSLEGRNPRTREANLERLGGTPKAEQAIKQGLQWLVRQQKTDGHWELHRILNEKGQDAQNYPDGGLSTIKTNTGATALALMAFLGHGSTHQTGDHTEVVAKGLKWLRSTQDPATGDLHDLRQEEGRQPAFYAHAMGTIVLCEALALTSDNELKPSAERAVKYLLESQHPQRGGWKYRPISKQMEGDLSVTGWALMALHTARMAGLEIQQEEFERASLFLDSVQARGSARYKYEPASPDSKATAALTAEALLCRQWLGWPKTFPQMMAGVKYVTSDENLPSWTAGRRNVYGWYYTSQMLHNLGGDDWNRWNTAVRDLVVKHQVTTGTTKAGLDTRGSWNPNSPPGTGEEYADKAGRLYLTSLCILILETPYRHQPVFEP